MVRGALVVLPDAEIDDDLLEMLADETGHRFVHEGTGGFGVELLATFYKDEAGNQLIEAKVIDAPVKAVLVRSGSVEAASKIRQAVGDHLGGWSEQMLRAQIEAGGLETDPGLLVALALSGGGGPLDDETVDLVNAATEHEDDAVAEWAAFAVRVWNDLQDSPIVIKDKVRELAPVLRPAGAVDGDEDWVTARPGVAGREIPRAAVWLRADDDAKRVFYTVTWDEDWMLEVVPLEGDDDGGWEETIATTEDGQTAIHLVRHPALADHVVVHGADAAGVVAALRTVGNVTVVDGPPVPDSERRG
ncbi:hypothetical protein ACFT2C_24870 [Promicromonospora sp. NPDC057138]|uniref:hypothetical protein n=1 Tax=Promicromonospora sp. NPDC057138 TaxID=3346031 RepID=UPI0036285F1B